MAKPTEMSRVLAVVVLILLILGIGVCFVPLSEQMPIQRWIGISTQQKTVRTPFGEQTELTRRYEQELTQKIVSSLEKLTGVGTVQATVQVQLDLSDETVTEQKETRTVDTTVRIHHVVGKIQKLSVSVLIDGTMVGNRYGRSVYQARSQKEMRQYEEIVKAVIGFQGGRGDHLIIQNIPFVEASPKVFGITVSSLISGIIMGIWVILLAGIICGVLFPYLKSLIHEPKRVQVQEMALKKATELCYQNPERGAQILKRWVYGGVKRPNPRQYSPAEEAGIVVLALGERVSKMLFSFLSDSDIREIGRRIAVLGRVARHDIQKVLGHFITDYQVPAVVFGNPHRLKEFLNHTVQNSQGLYSEISLTQSGKSVWDAVAQLDSLRLAHYLERKKPEVVAIILYHLSPELSGRVMGMLPKDLATRVLIHLTHLKQVKADVLEKMTREVAVDMVHLFRQEKEMSGVQKIASIFNTLPDQEQKKWMSSVSAENKEAGYQLAIQLKTWDDILDLSSEKIEELVAYVDKNVLARALSITPESKRVAFAPCIPFSDYEMMSHKFKALAEHPTEAKKAQELIVKTAQQLKLF